MSKVEDAIFLYVWPVFWVTVCVLCLSPGRIRKTYRAWRESWVYRNPKARRFRSLFCGYLGDSLDEDEETFVRKARGLALFMLICGVAIWTLILLHTLGKIK